MPAERPHIVFKEILPPEEQEAAAAFQNYAYQDPIFTYAVLNTIGKPRIERGPLAISEEDQESLPAVQVVRAFLEIDTSGIGFDDATEEAIKTDPTIQELLSRKDGLDPAEERQLKLLKLGKFVGRIPTQR